MSLVIDAIGSTLASGALEAWAVDGMHAEGQQRPPDRFFARAQMLSRTVMIVSGVTSGYLGDYDLTLPWLVAVGGFACTPARRRGILPAVARVAQLDRVTASGAAGCGFNSRLRVQEEINPGVAQWLERGIISLRSCN